MFHGSARRVLAAAFGTGVALTMCVAPAQAQPNCTAADLAGVMAGVTTATSAYLFTHPPVNDFFTSLKDKSADEKRAALTAYLDGNPQVKAELQGIRQPAVDFRARCGGTSASPGLGGNTPDTP
jgi:heme-binding protein